MVGEGARQVPDLGGLGHKPAWTLTIWDRLFLKATSSEENASPLCRWPALGNEGVDVVGSMGFRRRAEYRRRAEPAPNKQTGVGRVRVRETPFSVGECGRDGRKRQTSNYFGTVPHSLPTVPGKNQAGRTVAQGPRQAVFLEVKPPRRVTAHDLPPTCTTISLQLPAARVFTGTTQDAPRHQLSTIHPQSRRHGILEPEGTLAVPLIVLGVEQCLGDRRRP